MHYNNNNEIDHLFVSVEKVNAVIDFNYQLVNKRVACFYKIRQSELP